jgi:hypothetical protein
MMWRIGIIIAALVAQLSAQEVIVEIRRAGMCDFCRDSVWADTIPRRPLLAGGQWNSAKWTLPVSRYDVRVVSKLFGDNVNLAAEQVNQRDEK